jgi:RNA polymerase sigma factor (TIGR02999 family)
MNEVTKILAAIEEGDPGAAGQLGPLVYDELRRLAARRMVRESPGQTLQPAALVHEAYLRLVDTEEAGGWISRAHFFAVAAKAMRRILGDRAGRKRSRRRDEGLARVEYEEANLAVLGIDDPSTRAA